MSDSDREFDAGGCRRCTKQDSNCTNRHEACEKRTCADGHGAILWGVIGCGFVSMRYIKSQVSPKAGRPSRPTVKSVCVETCCGVAYRLTVVEGRVRAAVEWRVCCRQAERGRADSASGSFETSIEVGSSQWAPFGDGRSPRLPSISASSFGAGHDRQPRHDALKVSPHQASRITNNRFHQLEGRERAAIIRA